MPCSKPIACGGRHAWPSASGKIKKSRVVHKSTGGMLNPIPEPVDPVGNAPSSSLNTVAHLDPLPEKGEGLRKALLKEGRSLAGSPPFRAVPAYNTWNVSSQLYTRI